MSKPTAKEAYVDLRQTLTNESDIAGKNILTIVFGIVLIPIFALVTYLIMTNPEHETQILIAFAVIFMVVLIVVILGNYKLSEKNIRKKIKELNDRAILTHAMNFYITKQTDLDNVTFSTGAKYIIDVVTAISENYFYFIPLFGYTKRKLIKIPFNEIVSIKRIDESFKYDKNLPKVSNSMINSVSRQNLTIKTRLKTYVFLFSVVNRSFEFINLLEQKVPNKK